MITITKEVENFLGVKKTQVERFHLTEKELFSLELSKPGGFTSYLDKISQEEDTNALIALFEEIIEMSYGVLDASGDNFVKNAANLEKFKSTQFYSDLYIELATDAQKASDFCNGIAPKKIRERAAKLAEEEKAKKAAEEVSGAAAETPNA